MVKVLDLLKKTTFKVQCYIWPFTNPETTRLDFIQAAQYIHWINPGSACNLWMCFDINNKALGI